MAIVNGTVGANADDGQIYYDSGWSKIDGTTIWFGWYNSNPDIAYIRFTLSGAIASGSTISSAVLSVAGHDVNACTDFWACVSESADAPQVVDAGDRPAWANTGGAGDITTYPTTREGAGAIHWTSYSWHTDDTIENLTVTGLVQHLVDTYGGLASGAHIQFYLCGDDSTTDGNENGFIAKNAGGVSPTLAITYTGGGATNTVRMII